MSYYFCNTQELLQKAKNRYYKGSDQEKTARYYLHNKEVLRENAKSKYRTCRSRNRSKKAHGKYRYRVMAEDKKNKVKEYQKKYQT